MFEFVCNFDRCFVKYIFVIGGVVFLFGKGFVVVLIGCFFEGYGYCVILQKFDFYVNVDLGIMSLYQYGEVYVIMDGVEIDLDFGYYECFISIVMMKNYNWMIGKIYLLVI